MRQSVAPNELLHTYFCSFTYENIRRLGMTLVKLYYKSSTYVVHIRSVDLEPDGC